jgi:hypothetical protein
MVFALSRIVTAFLFAMEAWVTRGHSAGPTAGTFFRDLGAWDGIWYREIALHGYEPALMHGNTPAFFPLYPVVLKAAHKIFPFVDLGWLGAIISTLFFALALCMLYRLTFDLLGLQVARRAILYLSIAPLAFIFSAVYAESLFLVLAVATFLLLERHRRVLAGVAGALCVLSRPVGIMLAPAIVWRAFIDADKQLFSWRFIRYAWPAVLLPAAELGFDLYLWWRTGDPLATVHAESRGWGRGAAFPPALLWNTIQQQILTEHTLRYAIHVGFALLWLWLLVVIWRKRSRVPVEYSIFATGVVALPFLAGTLLSAGRYGMMGFPLFWALAIAGRREGVDTAIKILFPCLMATLVFVAYGLRTFTP